MVAALSLLHAHTTAARVSCTTCLPHRESPPPLPLQRGLGCGQWEPAVSVRGDTEAARAWAPGERVAEVGDRVSGLRGREHRLGVGDSVVSGPLRRPWASAINPGSSSPALACNSNFPSQGSLCNWVAGISLCGHRTWRGLAK